MNTPQRRLFAPGTGAAPPVTEYYDRRYRELEAGGLLPAAVSVASAFRGGPDATAADGTSTPRWPPLVSTSPGGSRSARSCTGSATSGARRGSCRP